MYLRKILILLTISSLGFLEAKPPSLTPHDTKIKIQEILKSHVTHKQLSNEIIRRTLINFLEELDPTKTYLLEKEVDMVTSPSDEVLTSLKKEMEKENFALFNTIYKLFVDSIPRRNEIEEKILSMELPKDVEVSEFKELKWAKNENELLQRLLRLKALQIDTADKLDKETKDQFFQRLIKRRLTHEQEMILSSDKEREMSALSFLLKSVASALDAHTAYFTPAEANQFMIQVQQRLFGIGAQLRDDLNGFTVIRLLEGSPGLIDNKLKIGDKIIAVNNEPVVGLDIFEAVEMIRGPKGSQVCLTILREREDDPKNPERLIVEMLRDEIVLKETRFGTEIEPYGDGVIAYVKLYSFYQDPHSSSASDLKNAIEQIKAEHKLLGIILDLRNNAGGLLPQAVNVASLFISKGIVVSIKDSGGKVQHLRNLSNDPIWTGPLFVLINRASASAAEIVAQSLQDYGRALIVGDTHSFGKGSYQTFTLESANQSKINPQGEYKVTRGMYYTVSGKSPQLVGTKSDITIPGFLSEMEIGEEFSKFPLENDQIPANFEDNLSDVHPLHRSKIRKLYKQGKQEVIYTYDPYIEQLKVNSKNRIETNQNYQNFLKELKKKDHLADLEIFGQNDLQLEEAINILKDLIFLEKEQQQHEPVPAAANE